MTSRSSTVLRIGCKRGTTAPSMNRGAGGPALAVLVGEVISDRQVTIAYHLLFLRERALARDHQLRIRLEVQHRAQERHAVVNRREDVRPGGARVRTKRDGRQTARHELQG